MNHLQSNIFKPKYNHLLPCHYEYIQQEYNHFVSSKKKGKTIFMRNLATAINTSLSNLYEIIKDGTVEVLNSQLIPRKEFSSTAALEKRKHKSNKRIKLQSAKEFIEYVTESFLDPNSMDSIDELCQYINIHEPDRFPDTVCTKTFYNYIHKGWVKVKRIDCPRILRRRAKKPLKLGKRQKGTSIELRPFGPNDRSIFGHWEGDCVVGKQTRDDTLFTLVERQTRFQIIMRLNKGRTAKQVFMAVNKLESEYGLSLFKKIFKSITFDNGNEFSRFNDIEKRPYSKEKRTSVFFAHPYSSWERGSNEHANGLIRYKIPKGYPISKVSNEKIKNVSCMINNKRRKILGYRSAAELFAVACASL